MGLRNLEAGGTGGINPGGLTRLGSISAIPDSGVGRWTFDDADTSSGTAIDVWGRDDASITQHDGTINGATTGVSGANQTYTTNEAYSFDGNDDKVSLGDIHDAVSNPFSFASWFKVDSYDGTQAIVSNKESGVGVQHILRVESDGNLHLYHNYGNGFNTVSVSGPSAGSWAFAFAFYDSANDTIGLSLDAGTRQTANTNAPESTTVDDWAIGYQNSNSAEYWLGDIDDPRVYNKVLSTTEVSNLYNNGSI